MELYSAIHTIFKFEKPLKKIKLQPSYIYIGFIGVEKKHPTPVESHPDLTNIGARKLAYDWLTGNRDLKLEHNLTQTGKNRIRDSSKDTESCSQKNPKKHVYLAVPISFPILIKYFIFIIFNSVTVNAAHSVEIKIYFRLHLIKFQCTSPRRRLRAICKTQ